AGLLLMSVRLLRPGGVAQSPPLLHQHAAVALDRIKCVTAEIALHNGTPVSLQVTKTNPTSRSKREYSATRMRRLDSRCAWNSSRKTPISDPSSAPWRISTGQLRLSWQ